MSKSTLIKGLSLKVGPLGENDRLLTFLSDKEGISRFAVPGARRPRSSLAAAAPLNLLELEIVGRSGLKRVRQMRVLQSFSKVGENLEVLAAAQSLTELTLLLVPANDPIPGILSTILLHLDRLQKPEKDEPSNAIKTLAKSVQAYVHILALGGYGLPIQNCCITGEHLNPPIGEWDWRCTFMPGEGLAIGSFPNMGIELNPSELALLQRLTRPNLPIKRDGELMGPIEVWLKLLKLIELWIENNLSNQIRSISILEEVLITSEDRR